MTYSTFTDTFTAMVEQQALLKGVSEIVKAHDAWWTTSLDNERTFTFALTVARYETAAHEIVAQGLFSDAVQKNVQKALDALINL